MLKREDLKVGENYKDRTPGSRGTVYELIAIGLFHVLIMDHVTDTEHTWELDSFLRDFGKVEKKIILYRYTELSEKGNIYQSEWKNKPYRESNGWVLLLTESKILDI
jgi:hypothetical protein